MTASPPVQLIAIVGGSGAGKTWFVQRLCRVLDGHACHLQLDNFYRDRSHLPPSRRARLNFDIPDAIDWAWAERVLRECRTARPVDVPAYDFATHCRRPAVTPWQPRSIVLVDGLWLLRPPAVRALFDLSVFLDTPAELRCRRRLERDVAERGYTAESIAHQLRTAVIPMHERYVEPQRKCADLVLQQPFREAELIALAERLWSLLARASLVPSWRHETLRAELFEQLLEHEYCS